MMDDQMLKTLCGLPGVSGAEEPVRYEILKQIEGHCIYRVDPLGNVLAFKKGRQEPVHSMLFSAHMDEVGLIVTYIEESGLLRFTTVGGIDRRVLPGKTVRIGEQPGVIGSKAVHLKSAEEKDKAPALDALYIDIGASNREEAEAKVTLGDRAVFCTHYCEMGAAAYKHVPLMEENPCEAVLVNVVGSRNVADKCIEYDVDKMVMISTDKAVNPTNIMGCTKRLAEIYVQSLGLATERGERRGRTRFVTTRFGNVLGSNGSVIPRFREQIAHGGPVTVTHPDITRFFMTIPEACRLVMEAATMSTGNQIFVFDMGASVKIVRLAERMIEPFPFILPAHPIYSREQRSWWLFAVGSLPAYLNGENARFSRSPRLSNAASPR